MSFEVCMPDYQSGLLNLMASAAAYFDVDTPYPRHPACEKLLEAKPDNLFIVLIDAMGSAVLEQLLKPDSFLRTHLVTAMTTVYPSTTAAATTILQSGLAPVSSGWMGWQQYFKEADEHRILFTGKSFYSDQMRNDNVIASAIGYKSLYEKIREKGHHAACVMPAFDPQGVKSPEELGERLIGLSKEMHDTYLYAYWDELDTLMHKKGTDHPEVKDHLERIDAALKHAAENLAAGTMMWVIADHGQINTRCLDLRDHNDLCACLAARPGLETRTTAFYVKPGREKRFERLFKKYYGDSFDLYDAESFRKTFMGPFDPHPRAMDFLGNYVAAAKKDLNLFYGKSSNIGQHAGLTREEMMIPLILAKGV